MKTSNKLLTGLLAVILLAIVGLVMVANNNREKNMVKGEGAIISETRKVDPFTGISCTLNFRIFVTQGAESKVEVKTYGNMMSEVITKVEDGKLHISADKSLSSQERVEVYITMPEVRSLEVSNVADLEILGLISGDLLEIDCSAAAKVKGEIKYRKANLGASSGGQLDISGMAEEAEINCSSGAEITAPGLQITNCTIDGSSGADMQLNIAGKVTGNINSGASLNFTGGANDDALHNNSGGSIRKR